MPTAQSAVEDLARPQATRKSVTRRIPQPWHVRMRHCEVSRTRNVCVVAGLPGLIGIALAAPRSNLVLPVWIARRGAYINDSADAFATAHMLRRLAEASADSAEARWPPPGKLAAVDRPSMRRSATRA